MPYLKMINLDLFKNIMNEARNNPDLLDSFSLNQFKSKENLINHIKKLNILNSESEIVIFGCWYGSILIPAFYDEVKRITAIDIDDNVIGIAKNRIFKNYDKIDFIVNDAFVWANKSSRIKSTNLIINTSCEHMQPMKNLPILNNINSHFAFQSNNMFDIKTHINCVNNIEEFKKQLPSKAKILIEDQIEEDRGIRFTLIGQL
jgi:2-polyprenyl-3-methyl-5-hydroxy-6-metoxy-1,4-benzoquinol methylase